MSIINYTILVAFCLTTALVLLINVHPETLYLPDGYSILFPIREREFFGKIKENEELRGGVCGYAAQVTPQFDAEVHEKGRFRMEIDCFVANDTDSIGYLEGKK